MKKFLAVLTLTLLTAAVLSGFNFAGAATAGTYVYDDGDYLTDAEEAEIQAAIEAAAKKTSADILVVFTDDPSTDDENAAAEDIAESWANKGLGYGKEQETIVFYVDLKNSNVCVDEYNGEGDYRMTSSEINGILGNETTITALSSGNYASATLQAVSDIRSAAKPGFFHTIVAWLLCGAAGGGISTLIGVGKHGGSTKVSRRYYLKEGKAAVLSSNERFVNTTREVIDHSTDNASADPEKSAGAGTKENHQGGSASFKKPNT